MPYTLGSTHAIATSSTVAIASPAGLKIALSNIPTTLGSRPTVPLERFDLGQIRLGTADGYGPQQLLELATTLLYPIPDSMTWAAVTLRPGVTAVVTELVGTLVPSALQPWDRGPTPVALSATNATTAPFSATLWTYTVPAGKMLWVASAELYFERSIVATSTDTTYLALQRGGSPAMQLYDYENVMRTRQRDTLSPAGLVLVAGEILSALASSSDTGGRHFMLANMTGFTFNA